MPSLLILSPMMLGASARALTRNALIGHLEIELAVVADVQITLAKRVGKRS